MDLSTTASVMQSSQIPAAASSLESQPEKMERINYQTSPHAPNTPENNICKLVEYRGAKVASFTVNGRELICLPQAFELFLKHLVGGLHTVYTKLKRLEITPVVCNVEQVRILRGLQSIQPGVNRCKLLSPDEFDVLYDDCTSSSARPGRPPKRSSFLCQEQTGTPNKLVKRDTTGNAFYPYEDLKPARVFPPYQPYPSSLPSIPFVPSAYQLNLMQQAAMQMAFANQMNLNRVTKNMAMTQGHQLMTSPSEVITRIDREKSTQSASEQSQDMIAVDLSPTARRNSDTLSPVSSIHSASSVERTSPLPQSQAYNMSHNTIPTPSTSPQGSEHSPRLHKPNSLAVSIPSQREIATHSQLSAPSPHTTVHPIRNSSQMIEDVLTHLRNDIQVFMSSVLQHQEELLGELDSLKSNIKQFTINQQCVNQVVQEHERTKELYKLHYDKQQNQKKQIEEAIRLSKAELTGLTGQQSSRWMMKTSL